MLSIAGLVLRRRGLVPVAARFCSSHQLGGGASGGLTRGLDGGRTVRDAVTEATDLLPNQGILENFVHHNPLEHLQGMPFKQALEHARRLEAYASPGERAKQLVHVDPRKRANEALVDLSSAFLDRGAAKWAPRYRDKGFLYFFAAHEGLGIAPWRRQARVTARKLMDQLERQKGRWEALSEAVLEENLRAFGVPQEEWALALRATMLELKGWAGMFWRMETHPAECPSHTRVRLLEFCAVQSILARASVETLARHSGWQEGTPLAQWLAPAAVWRKHEHEHSQHASAIASLDQSSERREALETEFKHTLLHAIGNRPMAPPAERLRPRLQVYTCIDDRECSLRRHLEEGDLSGVETYGVAGFFGIPIQYRPIDGREQMVLAPEGQTPTAVLVEDEKADHEVHMQYFYRRRFLARLALAWENASFSPIGSLALSALWPATMARLALMGMAPDRKQKIKEWFLGKLLPTPETDFQLPLHPEQAATMLARTFRDIGTHRRFAPLVLVLGHGAVSVNNPFFAAYNCGACGGREGGTNARLLARLANDPLVRACLWKDHEIWVPEDTWFLGGMHNTTADRVELYDLDGVPESHRQRCKDTRLLLDRTLGKNALERCHRFLLANGVDTPESALRHVSMRSTDAAEARPELNHATNAAVVIGRRELTKGHFLDRRVFLPSYDPFSDDDAGTNLEHVIGPALVVCSGINLEYLFSTIDDHHAAGTKAPLNIVGNIGVLQGTSGDLRPGLPSQMTEMHSPVRSLFIVDAPIARLEAVLARRPELRDLVRNEWVRLIVRDPSSHQFHIHRSGQYLPIEENDTRDFVPFTRHRTHALHIADKESLIYRAAQVAMISSCLLPIWMHAADAMNPQGAVIALCGTSLALPVLAFSRRYLHGEYMFGRFAGLCSGLLLGFNLVATAPTLAHALAGWGLFGFSSTFLIGAYNDRPTVRNNATYAFAAYRISDFAMLVAAAFSAHHLDPGFESHPLVAAGLLLAALLKSSQFPLTPLFVRSMEGPTPASALGYAGLSAHVGVVLLAGTMPYWFAFDWARITLGSVGVFTSVYATLLSKIRSDRKGAIANATSATLGLIYATLALGHPDTALLMCLGHASFRMIQTLYSPNLLADTQYLKSALGHMPWPKEIPSWLYRLCWMLRRTDTDFHLIGLLHWMSRHLTLPMSVRLSKFQQWSITGAGVVLAGLPFTPVSHALEEHLMHLLHTQPWLAGSLMAGHFAFSVLTIRFLLLNVLNVRRFSSN